MQGCAQLTPDSLPYRLFQQCNKAGLINILSYLVL